MYFTDASTGTIDTWDWDFGDGVGTSTVQNPTYIYNNPDDYDVNLTVTGPGGSDTETKTDYIKVGPYAIDEIASEAIDLYPNPADGMVQFTSEFEIHSADVDEYIELFVYTGSN